MISVEVKDYHSYKLPNSEYMIFPGIKIFAKQNIVMFKAAIQTITNCDGIRKAVNPTLKTSLTRVDYFLVSKPWLWPQNCYIFNQSLLNLLILFYFIFCTFLFLRFIFLAFYIFFIKYFETFCICKTSYFVIFHIFLDLIFCKVLNFVTFHILSHIFISVILVFYISYFVTYYT